MFKRLRKFINFRILNKPNYDPNAPNPFSEEEQKRNKMVMETIKDLEVLS